MPNLLLLTTNLQSEWPIRGQGTVIQTRVCKAKKKHQGEFSAYQLNEVHPYNPIHTVHSNPVHTVHSNLHM